MAVTLEDVERALAAKSAAPVAGYQPAAGATPTHDVEVIARPVAAAPAQPRGVTLADVEAALAKKASATAPTAVDQEIAAMGKKLDARLTGSPKTLAALGISAAGGAGGAALGGVVGGPVGAVAGEMAGSFLARKANVALGLEEAGLGGDILSAAVPGVVRGAAALKPALIKRLPGAATVLHEEGVEALQHLPEGLGPPVPSDLLYKDLAMRGNPPIRAQALWQTANSTLRAQEALQPSLRNPKIRKIAEDLRTLAQQSPQGVPLEAMQAHMQRVGLLVRQASAENWPQAKALKQLYGAFSTDLETAASRGIPEAAALKEANVAFKQERAVESLGEMFAPGQQGLKTRPDGLIQIHAGVLKDRFEKALSQDKNFREGLGHDAIQEVRTTLKELQKIPRMPAPHGQAYGSALTLGRGTGASGITYALTGDPQLAALAGGLVAWGPQALGWFFMTATGRNFLKRQLAERGGIDPAVLGALGAAGREALQPGTTVAVPPGTGAPSAQQ